MSHPFKHLRVILKHRHQVIRNGWHLGIFWHCLKHDLSKFGRTEFKVGSTYYVGTHSPIYEERLRNGYFSSACQHHTRRNKHHWEYWYDMINGEPAFIWNNGVKTINPASGYDPQHPYDNRDPRMDMCILHDGSQFHGVTFEMWVSTDGTSWGYDNVHQSSDNPASNQQMRKFMPPDEIPLTWQEKYVMPWIHFRLAEIYLNFAEAAFETGKEAECREYINKIRARVGMPGLPASVTGEALRARLYNERHIELVFEEHRYFDLRRWMIASEVLNRPGHGIKITLDKATGVKTYEDELLLDRKFNDSMYLLPIATDELLKNNGTLQQTRTWR